MAQISLVIDFLFRLLARRRLLTAPEPVNPRRPSHAISLFIVLGKISHDWGPLGCWTALTYFIVKTGHGASVFKILSNRFAESTFLVWLLSYLLRRFGCQTGSVDRVGDTVEHIATFFRHAAAAFKSGKDVVAKISTSSTAVSGGNNTTSNNRDPRNTTADVATGVGSSRSDNDDVQRDQEVNNSARADIEWRIISSIEEGKEIINKWKEGIRGVSLDVPLDMPAQTATAIITYFKKMGADCLLEGPNLRSILEKELASAQFDLEVATKTVADLQSLMPPSSSTG